MKSIPLAERVAAACSPEMGAERIRGLLRAVSCQPVRNFLWVCGAPESETVSEADGFFREDFPEDCYRDGDMTWMDALQHLKELENSQSEFADQKYLYCLLDLAMLCGDPDVLRSGKRRGSV